MFGSGRFIQQTPARRISSKARRPSIENIFSAQRHPISSKADDLYSKRRPDGFAGRPTTFDRKYILCQASSNILQKWTIYTGNAGPTDLPESQSEKSGSEIFWQASSKFLQKWTIYTVNAGPTDLRRRISKPPKSGKSANRCPPSAPRFIPPEASQRAKPGIFV